MAHFWAWGSRWAGMGGCLRGVSQRLKEQKGPRADAGGRAPTLAISAKLASLRVNAPHLTDAAAAAWSFSAQAGLLGPSQACRQSPQGRPMFAQTGLSEVGQQHRPTEAPPRAPTAAQW